MSDMEKTYWTSLGELETLKKGEELPKTKEFKFREDADPNKDSLARRDFLKIMGVSAAATATACVRKPAEKIVPYANRPVEVTPGVPNYYASTLIHSGEGVGVIIKTRDGRPIKLKGNKDFPLNGGGLPAIHQATVLDLYDPGRAKTPLRNLHNDKRTNRDTVKATWEAADAEVVESLKSRKTAILTRSYGSPSKAALLKEFSSATGARVFEWEASGHAAAHEANMASYGAHIHPRLRVDKAKMIVAVGCDFLGTCGQTAAHARGFAKNRTPGDGMNRLVAFESVLSLTGANADDRYMVKSSQYLDLLLGLASEIVVRKGRTRYANDRSVTSVLNGYQNIGTRVGIPLEAISRVADELWENRGKSLVVTGDMTSMTEEAMQIRIAANFLNHLLENDGKTLDWNVAPLSTSESHDSNLLSLIGLMNDGKVDLLIIDDVNVIHAIPEDLGFRQALKKTKLVVYTGQRPDETGVVADLILPGDHPLEAWGDAQFAKGLFAVQQPAIRPLYDTRSFSDSLIAWSKALGRGNLRNNENYFQYLKKYWRGQVYGRFGNRGIAASNFDQWWVKVLHQGFFDATGGMDRETRGPSFRSSILREMPNGLTRQTSDGLEVTLYHKSAMRDGKMANVGWIQEFPDPITRICWDNYANISPTLASERGWKQGDLIEIKVNGKTMVLPVHIQPGTHKRTIGVALGYGRTHAGDIGTGVGQNASQWLKVAGKLLVGSAQAAEVKKSKGCYELANIQGHNRMEGRGIVAEATNEDFKKNGKAGIHQHPVFSIWNEHKYDGHRWGMAIDQTLCVGCGDCVISCSAENNVPAVGKRYVLQGREMQWLRIDRYYVGEEENPNSVFQPQLCQQCDNAPCETVCPVLATVHTDEGLNAMAYNRCVGTRYCSNNCHFKVRRFNWFDYLKNIEKPMHMALNPDVTVRSRGVMEKCTFCVQRINESKSKARMENRPLNDGEIVTACQEVCPTDAIVFGDMNDANSKVSKMFKNDRAYEVLEYANGASSIRYLSHIRNTDKLKGESNHHGSHDEKGHHS